MLVKLEQTLKAELPILTTGKSSIVSGITTFSSLPVYLVIVTVLSSFILYSKFTEEFSELPSVVIPTSFILSVSKASAESGAAVATLAIISTDNTIDSILRNFLIYLPPIRLKNVQPRPRTKNALLRLLRH